VAAGSVARVDHHLELARQGAELLATVRHVGRHDLVLRNLARALCECAALDLRRIPGRRIDRL
jgi:hypothetical protein